MNIDDNEVRIDVASDHYAKALRSALDDSWSRELTTGVKVGFES